MTTKHIYKLPLLTLLVSAGLLTACSSDDEETEAPRRITIEVSEYPLTDATAQARETRGDVSTITTLMNDGFYMRGIFKSGSIYVNQSYTVTYSSGNKVWGISPSTWPGTAQEVGNSDVVSFYADTYCKTETDVSTFVDIDNDGNPYINFSVDENAPGQHDLLVAKNYASFDSSNGVGKVSLTFNHACAAIKFSIQMTKTLADSLGNNKLTVNSIELCNVNNTGKYYFKTNSWAEVGGNTFYTLDNRHGFVVTTTKENLTSNYLFVIPQTRAAEGTTGTYLKINYTVTGKAPQDANIEFAPNWEAGYLYPILIRLGTKQINYK